MAQQDSNGAAQQDSDGVTPTINQLRIMLAVAEKSSYSAAAEALEQPVSLVWRTVKRLRDKVGRPLFEAAEGDHPIQLSREGHALRPSAAAAVAAVDTFLTTVRAIQAGNFHTLRLGCSPTHLRGGVAAAIKRFNNEDHPSVTVQLSRVVGDERGGGETLFAELLRNELDLVIVPSRDVDPSVFSEKPFYPWWVVALFPLNEEHEERPIDVQELKDRDLLVRTPGFASRAIVSRACRRAGFEPRIAYEIGSVDAILALHDHGHGVAVIPHDVVPKHLADAVRPILARTSDPLGGSFTPYARKADVAADAALDALMSRLTEAGHTAMSPAGKALQKMAPIEVQRAKIEPS